MNCNKNIDQCDFKHMPQFDYQLIKNPFYTMKSNDSYYSIDTALDANIKRLSMAKSCASRRQSIAETFDSSASNMLALNHELLHKVSDVILKCDKERRRNTIRRHSDSNEFSRNKTHPSLENLKVMATLTTSIKQNMLKAP